MGWHIEKQMTTELISKAITKAVNLIQPKQGLVFHSDQGYNLPAVVLKKLLKGYGYSPQWTMWGRPILWQFET